MESATEHLGASQNRSLHVFASLHEGVAWRLELDAGQWKVHLAGEARRRDGCLEAAPVLSLFASKLQLGRSLKR